MIGNKPKIVNVLGQRKIQSLDFLLNSGKTYINFSESHYLKTTLPNVTNRFSNKENSLQEKLVCVTKLLCLTFILRLFLGVATRVCEFFPVLYFFMFGVA